MPWVRNRVKFAVRLPNGLEEYYPSRQTAMPAFFACAEKGKCSLVKIEGTNRTFIAESIKRETAPTLGHYMRAVASCF